jgi:hypothetical protein
MADSRRTVLVKLDAVRWVSLTILVGGGGTQDTPEVSPYLWTIFFTVDGATVRLAESGYLVGVGNVYPTHGKHGNLGTWSMNPLQSVGIPDAFGFWSSELLPIPVDPSVQAILDAIKSSNPGQDLDPHAVFGFLALLLHDGGHVPPQAVDAGRDALALGLKSFIDAQLNETLGIAQPSISAATIKRTQKDIQDAVVNAMLDSMSVWEKAWAISGRDEFIASWVRIYNAAQSSVDLNDMFSSQKFGTWALEGSVTIADSCPAEAIANIVNTDLAAAASSRVERSKRQPNPRSGLEAMRRFRDEGGLVSYPGLIEWWRKARENTAEVTMIMARDRRMRKSAGKLLAAIDRLLSQIDDVLSPMFLQETSQLLAGLERKGAIRLKAFAGRAQSVLGRMDGLTGREALSLLSATSKRLTYRGPKQTRRTSPKT